MTYSDNSLPALPANWVWSTIGEVYDIVGGGTPSTAVSEYWTGNIPWITSADIHGPKDVRPRKRISAKAISNSTTSVVPSGSLIVVTRVGLGKVAIAAEPLCFSQDSQALVSFGDCLDAKFALYYLSMAVQVFKYQNRGTTISGVTKKQLAEVPFPVAPLSEQKRIVQKVEELLTQLEAAGDELSQGRAQLKRYRQAVLKAAVTGELTKEWREAHNDEFEPASQLLARILKERRARSEGNQLVQMNAAAKMPVKDGRKQEDQAPIRLDVSQMPRLPKEWEWARLEELAAIKGGITKDSKRKVNGRSVPYLRVANVQRGHLDLAIVKQIKATEKEIADLKLEPGDILFNEGGDRDKLGRGWIWSSELPECIHQNHVFRARLYLPDMSPKFVSIFGNTFGLNYFLREGKQTTNLASINLTKLSALPVPVPPSEEQKRIVEEIDRAISIADALRQVINTSLLQAERVRQSILKQAFEGKLVPQDPNDEPAELLLERIKTERAKREAEKQAQANSKRKRVTKKRLNRTERPAA